MRIGACYAALLAWTFVSSSSAGNEWKQFFAQRKRNEKKRSKKSNKRNKKHYSAGSIQEFEEIVIWTPAKKSPPEFPSARIFLPNEISKITKTTFKGVHSNPKCGWSEYHTALDQNGDMLTVSIDNFLTRIAIDELRQQAVNSQWHDAIVHPDNRNPDDVRKGNGFPGRRIDASPLTQTLFDNCVAPLLKRINPSFQLDNLAAKQTMFGLVTKEFLPGGEWLDSQRLPHTDIDWQHGLHKNESTGIYEVPACYASLLSLTTKFNESGTGIYLEKETGWSLLKTLPMNERAQGNMNPHVENHLHKHLNLREEIPDPHPWSLDYTRDNAWIKTILINYLQYNRFTLYDGRRLHNPYVEHHDYPRLTVDPHKGRITMNNFWWGKP